MRQPRLLFTVRGLMVAVAVAGVAIAPIVERRDWQRGEKYRREATRHEVEARRLQGSIEHRSFWAGRLREQERRWDSGAEAAERVGLADVAAYMRFQREAIRRTATIFEGDLARYHRRWLYHDGLRSKYDRAAASSGSPSSPTLSRPSEWRRDRIGTGGPVDRR